MMLPRDDARRWTVTGRRAQRHGPCDGLAYLLVGQHGGVARVAEAGISARRAMAATWSQLVARSEPAR
jgi:hypothetical protein